MLTNEQPYYRYEPLAADSDSFRLLSLSPGVYDDDIKCSLLPSRVGLAANSYAALSYTWGDAGVVEEIKIDGKLFVVQTNLWLFLRQLRRHGHLLLWVDAICVDQSSANERSIQVGLMGSIYPNASQVLVWLGETEGSSDAALAFLNFYYLGVETGNFERSKHVYESLFEEVDCEPIWQALHEICSRRYWTRLWIIQEIILAKQIILFCGEQALTWEAFKYACAGPAMMRNFDGLEVSSLDRLHQIKSNISRSKFTELSRQRALEQHRGLWELIQTYGSSGCVDLRDRVYGLLELARDHQGGQGLVVDYTQNELHVLVDTLSFYKSRSGVFLFARHLVSLFELNNTSGAFRDRIRRDMSEEIEQLSKDLSVTLTDKPSWIAVAKGRSVQVLLTFQGKVGVCHPRTPSEVLEQLVQWEEEESVFETDRGGRCFTRDDVKPNDLVFTIDAGTIALLYRQMGGVRKLQYIGWAVPATDNGEHNGIRERANDGSIVVSADGEFRCLHHVPAPQIEANPPSGNSELELYFQSQLRVWDVLCIVCDLFETHNLAQIVSTWGTTIPMLASRWDKLWHDGLATTMQKRYKLSLHKVDGVDLNREAGPIEPAEATKVVDAKVTKSKPLSQRFLRSKMLNSIRKPHEREIELGID